MSAEATMRVRFAPSPTGNLHVGNVRTALVNWLMARHAGGVFLLRLDDTDRERSTEAFAAAIEEDLLWLGLAWNEMAVQSQRMARYEAAIARLKEAGRLYPCYETPDELQIKRKVALNAGRPPIYDRAALGLSEADRARLESEGRLAHWRFKLSDEPIEWQDLVRGPVHFEGGNLSDPVLLREDGRPLYTLTSVVDDLELGVTHVVRGEDHVTNTAVQVQLFAALGGEVPAFAHLALISGVGGEGLSKRAGSESLRDLRAKGIEPMAINSYLARLGTPDPIEPMTTLDELAETFDIARFGRATPKFDPEALADLSARVLHALPFEAVSGRLGDGVDEALWDAIRPNLTRLDEAETWVRICRGDVAPVVEDAPFLSAAADLLPPEPWDETVWERWTQVLKAETGRRGKQLFRPLRLALTGRETGPELKALLPLIGRERTRARLLGETA